MRALCIVALLAAGCALSVPSPLKAQQKKDVKNSVTSIRVTVTVLDPKGRPLPNAGVVMKQVAVDTGRMSKHPFDIEIHTDEKGTATVQGFEPGEVLVQVIAQGFQTYGQGFIMEHANENVHVKLEPPRSQVSIYKGGGGAQFRP